MLWIPKRTETALLSTHNIRFGWELRNPIFDYSCADPESFVRGVQLWQCFFINRWGGREDPKATKTGHHRPSSETPFASGPIMAEHWLLAWQICNFPWGFEPALLRNTIALWFFKGRGGGGIRTPCPPFWIRAWFGWEITKPVFNYVLFSGGLQSVPCSRLFYEIFFIETAVGEVYVKTIKRCMKV